MHWRTMTPEEIATRPETRLGGALLGMVIGCAIVVIVPAIGILVAFAVIASGGVHANPGNVFSWLDGPYRIGTVYMIPVGVFMAWSLLFVIMTLARLGATPMVASAGIVLWVISRLVLGYVGQAGPVAAAENTTFADALVRMWPYAIAIAAEMTLAAGFCGYMATGLRPNAYYRRRLPTG
jgi:hypothetical protein